MSLPVLPITFRGLNEGDDPKALPPGTLLKADNCAMDKARRLVKRWGTDGLVKTKVGGGSISAGLRLFEAGDSGLGLIDGSYAYTYAEDAALWQTVDRVHRLRAEQRPLVDSSRSAHAVDVALSGDLLITVWMASADQFAGVSADQPILFQVQDVTTWAMVVPPTRVVDGAGRHPRVTIHGTTADFWWTNAAGELRYRELNLSTFVLGSSTTQKNGLVASSMFDVHVDSALIYLAFDVSGTGLRIEAIGFDHSNEAGPVTVAALAGPLADVCIRGVEAEGGYVAWAIQGIGGTVELASFNGSTMAVTVGPTTMASPTEVDSVFVARESSTTFLLGWGFEGTSGSAYYATTTELVTASTHAVTANTPRTTNDILPVSRPWSFGGTWYLAAVTMAVTSADNSVAPTSTVVVEVPLTAYTSAVATHPHVGTLENQIGAPRALTAATANWIRGWTVPSGTRAYCASMSVHEPWLNRRSLPARRVSINTLYGDGDVWRTVKNGSGTLIVGAVTGLYDGLTVQPYGFARAPQIVAATAAAGGSVAAGTYQYCAVLVRIGPDGLRQRSAPSNIISATTAGGNLSVALRIAAASLAGKITVQTGYVNGHQAPTHVELYRTTIGGSILYRLTIEPIYNLVANDPTAAFATFTDTVADADITGGSGAAVALSTRPQLYTYLELEDLPPPASISAVVHKNRFAVLALDGVTLAVSKDMTEDPTLLPGFHESLTLAFPSRKVALASLDDKLVALGADTIDIVVGEPPDANGAEASWQIARVQTDVGCVDAKSVCVSPVGVVFQSRRGLELLDRGMNVTPIGSAVEDTLASYPYVTSAVLVARDGEVRWTCVDAAYPATPNGGVVVVWDYVNKIWFVRKYKDAAATDVASIAFADAQLIGGVYTMVTYGGQVYREDRATYLDDGTDWVERDVQLAWISPGGANGWHRFKSVQVLGTSVTNHDLKVSIARDYSASWEQDNTFAAQGDVTTVGPLEKCRVTIARQKAQAIRVRLQDLTPTTGSIGTGAGPIFEGLALQVETKRGTAKNSSGRQS